MIFLLLGGILAGLNTHVRQVPDFDYRTIVITLASPGSSPRGDRGRHQSPYRGERARPRGRRPGGRRRLGGPRPGRGGARDLRQRGRGARRRQERGRLHREFPAAERQAPEDRAQEAVHRGHDDFGFFLDPVGGRSAHRGGEFARRCAGPALGVAGPAARHAGPGNLHRDERGGAAPQRPVDLRGGAQGAPRLAQPDIRRTADRRRGRGPARGGQAHAWRGVREHSADRPARRVRREAGRRGANSRRLRR